MARGVRAGLVGRSLITPGRVSLGTLRAHRSARIERASTIAGRKEPVALHATSVPPATVGTEIAMWVRRALNAHPVVAVSKIVPNVHGATIRGHVRPIASSVRTVLVALTSVQSLANVSIEIPEMTSARVDRRTVNGRIGQAARLILVGELLTLTVRDAMVAVAISPRVEPVTVLQRGPAAIGPNMIGLVATAAALSAAIGRAEIMIVSSAPSARGGTKIAQIGLSAVLVRNAMTEHVTPITRSAIVRDPSAVTGRGVRVSGLNGETARLELASRRARVAVEDRAILRDVMILEMSVVGSGTIASTGSLVAVVRAVVAAAIGVARVVSSPKPSDSRTSCVRCAASILTLRFQRKCGQGISTRQPAMS